MINYVSRHQVNYALSETETEVLNLKISTSKKGIYMSRLVQLLRRFRSSERLSVLLNFLSSKGFSGDKFKYFNSDFPKKDVSFSFPIFTFFLVASRLLILRLRVGVQYIGIN